MTVENQSKSEATADRWFVVETNARQERRANFQLFQLGYRRYLPMRASLSKAVGSADATPLFPSYMFVADPGDLGWADVRRAPGIRSAFLSSGSPALAPRGLVEALRAREVYGLVQLKAPSAASRTPFSRGDRLRIVAGAFEGFDALFEDMADRDRVWLMLSLFGRETRVALPATAVKKTT